MEEKDRSPGMLTQEEKRKVVSWLTERAPEAFTCSVCRHHKWTIGDHLVGPMIFRHGGIILGGSAYPTVMLFCNNCGNTLYLNAVLMGLVPPEKTHDVEKESSTEGGSNA